MINHYKNAGTPLRSVFVYPDDHNQIQRFNNLGYFQIDYNFLSMLWSDPRFLSPSQRLELDAVEPFDEWEEFYAWASHYCIVVASNSPHTIVPTKIIRPRRDSISSDASDISARTTAPCDPEFEHFAFKYYSDPGELCLRHHGSAYPVQDQDAIAIFGGMGSNSCLSTSAVCRPRHLEGETPVVLPPEVGARCCHVIMALGNGDNFLVGGRRSPTQPLKDCWLQKGNVWHRVHDLPEGRYRHRIAPVTLPGNVFGAICFGGKISATKVATDILLWEPAKGWRVLRVFGSDPKPRFGPTFVCLGFNHGLLFGGLRQDGVVCSGFWRWRLVIRDNEVLAVRFRASHAVDASAGSKLYLARFGASYGFVQDYLLIIGGISKDGIIPRSYEILSLTGTFSSWHDNETKEPSFRVATVEAALDPNCPRPVLIGHSTRQTRTGSYVILGGGHSCFQFGDLFNKGIWVLHEKEAGIQADWITVSSKASVLPATTRETVRTLDKRPETLAIQQLTSVETEDFLNAVRESRPISMKDLDFGSCTKLWSLPYLRGILIHHPHLKQRASIYNANQHRRESFVPLLDEVNVPQISFPIQIFEKLAPKTDGHIGAPKKAPFSDHFQLPSQLEPIRSLTKHISLTISKDIISKLQYSPFAFILVQIRGARKTVIFPPADHSSLGFKPQATESDFEVMCRCCNSGMIADHNFTAPSDTNPRVTILRPGDCLFVPPFWPIATATYCDTLATPPTMRKARSPGSSNGSDDSVETSTNGTPREPRSRSNSDESQDDRQRQVDISVKIMFSTFSPKLLSVIEGQKSPLDLAAYHESQRYLQHIVKKFSKEGADKSQSFAPPDLIHDHIPKALAKAYLQRLGKELLAKADEL
jgi:tRNA wybutosine-synthesizing protein 4